MKGRQFALIGHPLGHSCSPEIHQRLFALSGDHDASYTLRDISREKIVREMPELMQLDGFNVTIPHKIVVCRTLKKLDISAKRYGAVNTVKRQPDGICVGYNTDVDGFLRSLETIGASLSGNVLLLGCGGAGHMMAVETALHGGRLTIAVRPSSMEKAENVKKNIAMLEPSVQVQVSAIDKIPNEQYDLLLNATPCGMFPHADEMPVAPEVLERVGKLFDAIYNPGETLLMKTAREMGVQAVGGMTMLVWQAVVAHEIWDGAHYSPADIQALIEEMQAKL